MEYANEGLYQALAAMMGFIFLIVGVASVLLIVSKWVLYSKAGEPGYAAIIPIYDMIIMLKIANMPWYYIFFFCIPIVNIVFMIIALFNFLKAYGKGDIASFLLAFFFQPIYFLYLAFSKNVQYVG